MLRWNSKNLSLEDLANDSRLIPEIFHHELEYKNPKRDKEIFYEFVREYTKLLKFNINEVKFGLKHQLMVGVGLDNIVYLLSPTFVLDLLCVFGGSRGLIKCPDTSISDRDIVVGYPVPRMLGKYYIRGDTKIHEYLHAYHFLLSIDLKENHLTKNGFLNGVLREQFTQQRCYKAPDTKSLKEFEKRIIRTLQPPKGRIKMIFSKDSLYAILNFI